ncbi:nucleoside deaminase [Boseongicola sp. H5]|uniref:nucleoside deaminase n=1 Tax=Boseongicola sp. H5 TaxID=2763261 RepID=UPI001B21B8C3|nr:nucleoside deaminase [Boseongicola sp. H5]MBO6922737.1 nucleoside deaminase [Roseicyclus sp.]
MTKSLLSPELAERLMTEVVALASNRVKEGGVPFSSSVVTPEGNVLGSGVNTVMTDHDPTAHAEVCAIRHACAAKGLTNLSGNVLLASGEPCAMCYIAALFAGVSEVIYAVSATQAAQYGYAYGGSYKILAGFPEKFPLPRWQLSVPGALQPFEH